MGLLFYFLGTLFIQGFMNYLIAQERKLAGKLYILQYMIEYVFLILLNIAVFCRKIFKPNPNAI